MREPPKPRLVTIGSLLKSVSRSSHSRIDELPTNSTPPGCGACATSAAAKASRLWRQRSSIGAVLAEGRSAVGTICDRATPMAPRVRPATAIATRKLFMSPFLRAVQQVRRHG